MAAPPVTSLTDLKKQWSDTAKDGLADAAAVIKDLQTLQTKAAKLQPTDPQFKSANDELEALKKRVDALAQYQKNLDRLQSTTLTW